MLRKVLALAMLAGLVATATVADHHEKKMAADKADMPAMGEMSEMEKAMMEKWMKYAKPGPQHEALAKDVGKWKVTAKFWMGGPGSEPMVTEGMAEKKMILGGRWLEETFKGEFMGEPFEGLGMFGYDNYEQKYVSSWMDDMSTMMMTSKGTCTPDGKMCTFFGLMDEPAMDVHDKMVRSTYRVVDENTRVYTSYDMLPGGEEFMAMEITYRRMK